MQKVRDIPEVKLQDLDFSIVNEGVVIKNYLGKDSKIKIPNFINNIPVVAICHSAFKNKKISHVIFPESIKKIEENAFAENNIKFISIPSFVELGSDHYHTETYGFGDGTGEYTAVTRMPAFPKGFDSSYKVGGFYTFNFWKSNWNYYPYYELNNGYYGKFINVDGKEKIILTGYNKANYDKYISIPDKINNVEIYSIAEHAFFNKEIISLKIPPNIKSIGDGAFYGCNLYHLKLNDGVEKIGQSAFGNNKLENIEIPDSVTDIGDSAFSQNRIKTIKFSNKLKEIPTHAFLFNEIENLIIPKNINLIGLGAFSSNKLKKIILEGSTIVCGFAFDALSINIKEIIIKESASFLDNAFGVFDESFVKYFNNNLEKKGRFVLENKRWMIMVDENGT